MLSDRSPSLRYSVEQLPSGRWVVQSRASDGCVLRLTHCDRWAYDNAGDGFTTWATQEEAQAAYLPHLEAMISADTWQEIEGDAPKGWTGL